MILDNQNEKTVCDWIKQYTTEGKIDAVSGYVTIGALAFLSEQLESKIEQFRFIFGQLSGEDDFPIRTIDLLNENISVEAALEIPELARQSVAFLEKAEVKVRTLVPDFCHAKLLLSHGKDKPQSYFISGSSNLTDAGLGLKPASNVELNMVGQGTDANFDELKKWFKELWGRKECKEKIKIEGQSVSVKQYLIDQISKLFQTYSPRDIYFRILFEMFAGEMDDWDQNRDFGRLEASAIWTKLYRFQKQGVLSLIKRLERFDGAILADAVGLGKTWSALAIAKYFQNKGRDIIVLCPKKLHHNWGQYEKDRGSCFESDKLEFKIRYHTDLQDERMDKDGVTLEGYFQRASPKLIIIDESHNFRNHASNRYKFLVEHLLKANEDVKVLLLSATPINTKLTDVRNQFQLLVKGDIRGYKDSLGVNNLQHLFGRCNSVFQGWSAKEDRTIDSLMSELDGNFIKLSDSLVVSRTRRLILRHTEGLSFPKKSAPQNIFLEESLVGKYETMADFIQALPETFAAYMPAYYLDQDDDVDVLADEKQRDYFLARMMHTLLVKRFESSWQSFHATLNRVNIRCLEVLAKIQAFEKDDSDDDPDLFDFDASDLEGLEDEEFSIGQKRKISLKEISDSGNLKEYKANIKRDIKKLGEMLNSLSLFNLQIEKEKGAAYMLKSRDEKLQKLLKILSEKQKRSNPKVVIFTSFTDTAEYLYTQLQDRGYSRLAMVSGSYSRVSDQDAKVTKFEPLLERFAPYTKLFLNKEWPNIEIDPDLPIAEQYNRWSEWIQDNDPKNAAKLDHPIDILIATDCLSEGQNLQDADLVINYDIHWNPVRAIQRMGRIDRLGSRNEEIYAINFWPTADMDEYLNLKQRIEDRMTQMCLIGSEVDSRFTENLEKILDGNKIEETQEAALLKQMELSWDDIEGDDNNFGFDKLSLETFRQQLIEELRAKNNPSDIPPGMYSGFQSDDLTKTGIVALLGFPAKRPGIRNPQPYRYTQLVCIDESGAELLHNSQDILTFVAVNKDAERLVPEGIDAGDPEEVQRWKAAITAWLDSQAKTVVTDSTGKKTEVAGAATTDLVQRLMQGGATAIADTGDEPFEDRFQADRFDLVCWMHVAKGASA